jgi:hypothetical protein
LKTVESLRVPWVRIPPPPPEYRSISRQGKVNINKVHIIYGELAELAEGARLLSEYMGLNLYRGFESLTLRQNIRYKQMPYGQIRMASAFWGGLIDEIAPYCRSAHRKERQWF